MVVSFWISARRSWVSGFMAPKRLANLVQWRWGGGFGWGSRSRCGRFNREVKELQDLKSPEQHLTDREREQQTNTDS